MLFANVVLLICNAAVVCCEYLIILVMLVGRAPCFHGRFGYYPVLFQPASANSCRAFINPCTLLCTARAHPMNFVRLQIKKKTSRIRNVWCRIDFAVYTQVDESEIKIP